MKLVPVSCNHPLVFRYIITSTHNSSAQHDGSFSCFMTLVCKIQQWILVHTYLWRSKYFKICLLVRVRVMRSFFWLRTMNARHILPLKFLGKDGSFLFFSFCLRLDLAVWLRTSFWRLTVTRHRKLLQVDLLKPWRGGRWVIWLWTPLHST